MLQVMNSQQVHQIVTLSEKYGPQVAQQALARVRLSFAHALCKMLSYFSEYMLLWSAHSAMQADLMHARFTYAMMRILLLDACC